MCTPARVTNCWELFKMRIHHKKVSNWKSAPKWFPIYVSHRYSSTKFLNIADIPQQCTAFIRKNWSLNVWGYGAVASIRASSLQIFYKLFATVNNIAVSPNRQEIIIDTVFNASPLKNVNRIIIFGAKLQTLINATKLYSLPLGWNRSPFRHHPQCRYANLSYIFHLRKKKKSTSVGKMSNIRDGVKSITYLPTASFLIKVKNKWKMKRINEGLQYIVPKSIIPRAGKQIIPIWKLHARHEHIA